MLRQVILVPLLGILIGAGALYWQIHETNLTVGNIELSDERIAETLTIEKMIVDEESGLRGYQTTGDVRFLEPYHAAEKQLPGEFEKRRAMATDENRKAEVTELEQLHSAWEDGFAEPVIASISAGATAVDVDLNMIGKRRMDEIRQKLVELNALPAVRRAEYIRHWRSQIRSMTIAMILVAIVLGLVIGLYTRRLLQDVSAAYRTSHNILRTRAEQIFRSEQKLRTTLESIGDAVITCDADGCIETMNEVACALTGWTNAEALHLPLEQVFNIINETTREVVENPAAKVKRENRVVGMANHTILIRKDGTELFIDDSGAPIRDKAGELIGVVLVFRDITLAKKSRDALLANEKLAVAGRLAATIAHEIHNPLDSVSNLLFLMDGNCTPEENSQFLEMARGEISRVTQISRAMLSLHREAQVPVPIDLKEMLDSILLLMQRRFMSLGVTVESSLPENLIIHGFPAELRQVFTNLLTNAAEASGAQGVVRLAATLRPAGNDERGVRYPAGAVITIEDHGPGIPESIVSKLFRPFVTTKGEQGTGLGLWVSRGIVNKHGGEIDLTSTTSAEDHGTTVSVFLAVDPTVTIGGD
jgi:PAS domain S-box-containing protein